MILLCSSCLGRLEVGHSFFWASPESNSFLTVRKKIIVLFEESKGVYYLITVISVIEDFISE